MKNRKSKFSCIWVQIKWCLFSKQVTYLVLANPLWTTLSEHKSQVIRFTLHWTGDRLEFLSYNSSSVAHINLCTQGIKKAFQSNGMSVAPAPSAFLPIVRRCWILVMATRASLVWLFRLAWAVANGAAG